MNVHTKWNCFITIRDDIIVSQRLPWKRGGANKSGAWLTANVRVRRAGRAHCARYIKFSHVRKSKFLSDSDSEPVFFCYDSFVKMESGKRKYLELWKRRTPCSTPHGASILRRAEFRAVTSLRLHTTKQFQEGAECEFVCIPLVSFILRRKRNCHKKRVEMPFSVGCL